MIPPSKIILELRDRSLVAYEEPFPYTGGLIAYDASTVFNDTSNNMDELNSNLTFAGGTSTYGETAVWGKVATVNTQGLAIMVSKVIRESGTVKIGLDTNQAGDTGSLALLNSSNTLTLADGGAAIGLMTADDIYSYAFIMNNSGGVYVCVRGGEYQHWTLLAPLSALTGTPVSVYPSVNNYDAVLTVGKMTTCQLLNTWDTANDLVQASPAATEGTTFSHHYNCIVSWTQISLADATTDMEVRKRSGSSASVRFRVESDGTARIIEHDGSSPSTLASSSAGAVSLNDVVYASVYGKRAYFVFGADGSGGGIQATTTGHTEFEQSGSVLSYSGGTQSFSNIKVYDARITDRLAAQLDAMRVDDTAVAAAYSQTVIDTSPIAYWQLIETSGTVITDSSGNSRNGTYSGVTLAQNVLPMGGLAPKWDGVNDYGDVYSAGLASAFDLDEGCLLMWAKVRAGSVWSDGTLRRFINIQADGSNRILIQVNSGGALIGRRDGDGVTHSRSKSGFTSTDWFTLLVSWSVADDEFKFYVNGVQEDATLDGLSAGMGSLNSSFCAIGAVGVSGASSWDGYLAHVAIWDHAVNNDIIALMTV